MNGKQHKTDNGKGVTAEVLLPNDELIEDEPSEWEYMSGMIDDD